ASQHSEVRMLGLLAYQELFKVSPNVLSKIDDKHGVAGREFLRELNENDFEITPEVMEAFESYERKGLDKNYTVKLIDSTSDPEINVATALLYKHKELPSWPAHAIREVLMRVK